ncbi:Hypothetical protein, putative [Bodo saltans]|uniref:Uncharacterized protein n=1 Tax=Bodo saltans TaxID=75058 RepID=A0A0S4IQ22_BODSA|nr:Hypothetical protein, putative [Bodo saltans]|eukprot:CUF07194.1 Hypothetical protein, putative [Bodo saltans]
MADSSRVRAMAAEHLVSTMTHHRGWMPTKPTKRRVALVIDELGQFPLFLSTRAIAKITQPDEPEKTPNPAEATTEPNEAEIPTDSIMLFRRHFMCTDVRIILVGTGTDHAFAAVGSLPHTQVHLSANDFTDVKEWYEKHSMHWQSIQSALDPLELQRGVFSKILRLSRNPRMAVILRVLDPVSVDPLLRKAHYCETTLASCCGRDCVTSESTMQCADFTLWKRPLTSVARLR